MLLTIYSFSVSFADSPHPCFLKHWRARACVWDFSSFLQLLHRWLYSVCWWSSSLYSFLNNYFIYFNWKISTLQYCDDLCHTSAGIGVDIHVSPFLPSPTSLPTPSLWVVPEHWLWVPCFMHRTCIGHLFYICNIHVSLQFSQVNPLLPQNPKVCSLNLCLFCCSACRIIITIIGVNW